LGNLTWLGDFEGGRGFSVGLTSGNIMRDTIMKQAMDALQNQSNATQQECSIVREYTIFSFSCHGCQTNMTLNYYSLHSQ